jgi:predicted PurR-regulated permease PerM
MQRALKWTLFVAASGLIVYLCALVAWPFAGALAWSIVLSIVCYPVHVWLLKKSGRPAVSAFTTSTIVVFAIVVPLVLVAGLAAVELSGLAGSLPRVPVADHGGPIERTTALLAWVANRVGLDGAAVAAWAGRHADELARSAGSYTLSIAATVAETVSSFALVIVAMFLLLRDAPRVLAGMIALLPFEPARSTALLLRIRDVVLGSVYGVVVISVLQGVLCGGMFGLLGIPAAALWGLVTVFASLIPAVGTATVWVPGVVYLAVGGSWLKAIVLAVWCAGVVSTIDNFLRPRLVAGRVGLGELPMFIAMLGGLRAFGLLGIVLGPVLFATAVAIVDALTEVDPKAVVHERIQTRVVSG